MTTTPRIPASPVPSPVRDAYLRTRYPDVIVAVGDFHDSLTVIDGARRCVAGGQSERASRLLELAVDERPEDESLWLAWLEILSHAGARAGFLGVVRGFLDAHPDTALLPEVVHFWKRLPAD